MRRCISCLIRLFSPFLSFPFLSFPLSYPSLPLPPFKNDPLVLKSRPPLAPAIDQSPHLLLTDLPPSKAIIYHRLPVLSIPSRPPSLSPSPFTSHPLYNYIARF
ncbi:hypothetical protein BO78DRAFT_84547 [Aspergillus sclerotiicarbonarius CBS 121057]|uniref:Uncharacterized protein n=1 Tax=Aspergillus sclerotiicarbonarius (strain CBS 121057 / IBT 28362) TaxID=1448318 RepID=A0A319FJE4_ASPSB|nr:hypothetical protein BO78DRAFT_84547 [Aspergillus sclerotiicarbonarius CBS 121057]